jgi:hypothetical protein
MGSASLHRHPMFQREVVITTSLWSFFEGIPLRFDAYIDYKENGKGKNKECFTLLQKAFQRQTSIVCR